MEFLELAKSRYSLRKMDSSKKIDKELLEKIVETARISPSACNLQRHRLYVVSEDKPLEKIRQCTPCHFGAPVVIIICIDSDTKGSIMDKDKAAGTKFGLIDAGIVASHMALEAADLGIGSTIVGMFDEKKLRAEFDIPQGLTPVLLLPLGYPEDGAGPCIKHKSRLPIDETVRWM